MKIGYANIKNYLRKTCKYGFYIPWSNLLLTYGYKTFSKEYLRSISDKRNRKIQQILAPVIEEANQMNVPPMEQGQQAPIWVCWFQGEQQMPAVPRLCLASIRRHANGHPVILLTSENYQQYVSMPDIVLQRYKAGQLKPAHFADILRIHLLAQRGGLWLDATLLLTKPIPEEFFSMPFFTIKTKPEGNFVSQCRWAVFCLAAWKHNPLFVKLAKAFELYLQQTDVFVDYFMFDQFVDMLYQRDPEIRRMIDEVPMNNAKVHRLGSLLGEHFETAYWATLTEDTYLFKLSWKTFQASAGQEPSSVETYYDFLHKRFEN